ncbi:hypothetical protein [Geopseudomonas aromaticivorans]
MLHANGVDIMVNSCVLETFHHATMVAGHHKLAADEQLLWMEESQYELLQILILIYGFSMKQTLIGAYLGKC